MNGIVVLDKPRDITSFQAARIVGRLFGREKTGHAGTLDPMATGVLPVMVGRATKLLQFLPETGKEYEAEALFGIRTDTADADGVVLETGGRSPEVFCGEKHADAPDVQRNKTERGPSL